MFDRLSLHRLPFKVGDLTCNDAAARPFIPKSALGRDRGMKVKLVTMVVISRLLSVRVPQPSFNNRNPQVDAVYSLVVGALLGCGEERHQGTQLIARVEHARFHGVNRGTR